MIIAVIDPKSKAIFFFKLEGPSKTTMPAIQNPQNEHKQSEKQEYQHFIEQHDWRVTP